jgi:hypothetical protein
MIHFVKEGAIVSPDSRSSDKFMHGIKVLMAKNYVDNLSEEVRKGLREKAEQGHWPSVAPVGYVNNLSTHRIEVDPVRGPLLTRIFGLYATENLLADGVDGEGARDGPHPPAIRAAHDEGRGPSHPAESDLPRRVRLARKALSRLA